MNKKTVTKDQFQNQKVCNVVTCIHQAAGRCTVFQSKEECIDFYEKQLIQEN